MFQLVPRDCHALLRKARNDKSGSLSHSEGRNDKLCGLLHPEGQTEQDGRGLRPGHGFYTRREEGWKTCGGILLTFRASA